MVYDENVRDYYTREMQFATVTKDGVVQQVGKSFVTHPPIKFTGGEVKWFDDNQLLKGRQK